jgi:hypothetical protein
MALFLCVCFSNCKKDYASLLDNLHSLLKGPNRSPSDPRVAQQVQQEVGAAVSTACKARLTSRAMLSTSTFIYFKEYNDMKQSPTFPYKKLDETVGVSVPPPKNTVADLAHLSSIIQHVTATIKNCFDFDQITSTY